MTELTKPDFDVVAVLTLSTIVHMVVPKPVTIPNECFDLVADALRAAYSEGCKDERDRRAMIAEVERAAIGGAQDVRVRAACDRIINAIREGEGEGEDQ